MEHILHKIILNIYFDHMIHFFGKYNPHWIIIFLVKIYIQNYMYILKILKDFQLN
jgi:hypothetical protein